MSHSTHVAAGVSRGTLLTRRGLVGRLERGSRDMSVTQASNLTEVELVRQCLEAFKRGDIPLFLSVVAENCQWSGSTSPDIPYCGQFTGPQGAMKFFEAIGGNLDIKAFDIERYVGDGEHVVAIGTWSGLARKTGRHFTARLALYFQVRDGKIIRAMGHE